MINNLLRAFTKYWPYTESATEPFIVEDTGKSYRLIVRNTCEWYKNHGGCTMCNYTDRFGSHATSIIKDNSEQIIDSLIALNKTYTKIKFYVNGSFFNENEMNYDSCIVFIKRLKTELGITELCVETRPEYVTRDLLLKYKKETGVSFEVCFGLESTDEVIRNQCYHKGISYSEFLKVIHSIEDLCTVKVYLLIKPPFVSEKRAIEDIVSSVKSLLAEGITKISYTPIAVQENTLLEFLLQENLYHPVWLWSIIEINSRLKDLRSTNPDIHLGGLDYYPEPLQKAFNCEHCSDKLLNMLMENPDLTWDDFDFKCDCYNRWHLQLESETDTPIKDAISIAEEELSKTINRSISIYSKTNSQRNPMILRDVAKTAPIIKCVLDNVGIENVTIPLTVDTYRASLGECAYSIKLDEFHRGIHMSRLIERLNTFSKRKHTDILLEMENDLLIPSAPTNIEIKFKVMDTVLNPLTDNINYISLDVDCNVSSYLDGTVKRKITVSIPFINACPCTKETVQELFGESFTHTQRGKIHISFYDCDISFNSIIEYVKKYIGIFDLLKREDEVYIVNKAHKEALFCEDMCRNVSYNIRATLPISSGRVTVRVVTEESIHTHNAFAEKTFLMG